MQRYKILWAIIPFFLVLILITGCEKRPQYLSQNEAESAAQKFDSQIKKYIEENEFDILCSGYEIVKNTADEGYDIQLNFNDSAKTVAQICSTKNYGDSVFVNLLSTTAPTANEILECLISIYAKDASAVLQEIKNYGDFAGFQQDSVYYSYVNFSSTSYFAINTKDFLNDIVNSEKEYYKKLKDEAVSTSIAKIDKSRRELTFCIQGKLSNVAKGDNGYSAILSDADGDYIDVFFSPNIYQENRIYKNFYLQPSYSDSCQLLYME